MTVIGRKGAIEQEHGLEPVHVLAGATLPGLPPMLLSDGRGRLPIFARREHAEIVVDRLGSTTLPGSDEPLFDAVAVIPVWRNVIADSLLHDAGLIESPAMTDEEAEALILKAYVFESQTFDARDAREQCHELARSIAAGLVQPEVDTS